MLLDAHAAGAKLVDCGPYVRHSRHLRLRVFGARRTCRDDELCAAARSEDDAVGEILSEDRKVENAVVEMSTGIEISGQQDREHRVGVGHEGCPFSLDQCDALLPNRRRYDGPTRLG